MARVGPSLCILEAHSFTYGVYKLTRDLSLSNSSWKVASPLAFLNVVLACSITCRTLVTPAISLSYQQFIPIETVVVHSRTSIYVHGHAYIQSVTQPRSHPHLGTRQSLFALINIPSLSTPSGFRLAQYTHIHKLGSRLFPLRKQISFESRTTGPRFQQQSNDHFL